MFEELQFHTDPHINSTIHDYNWFNMSRPYYLSRKSLHFHYFNIELSSINFYWTDDHEKQTTI
jgi:hypothetical protein